MNTADIIALAESHIGASSNFSLDISAGCVIFILMKLVRSSSYIERNLKCRLPDPDLAG